MVTVIPDRKRPSRILLLLPGKAKRRVREYTGRSGSDAINEVER